MKMTTDTDDGDFLDTLGEILGAPFMATTALDFNLAFGAVDFSVDFDRPHILCLASWRCMQAKRVQRVGSSMERS